ncbi:MAG TPA: hypothetical protein DEF00_03185 [Candidatus Taylorbacteria bacterium]|nr:MAG: hypothetical protein UY29_C0006G0042 [Parcubacteria group bacterium GW2011_GWC2_48_17]HBV01370.1 hypothetical protein [Candidatus Taylorbacteria bacterium]
MKKQTKWLALGFGIVAIIVVATTLQSLNSYKLSRVPSKNLLAESSASASSQKAQGDVRDFKIDLYVLGEKSTLATPASCVSADYLKKYPQMPKKWAERTKCGQVYMKNTIYQHQRNVAQASADWLTDNIIMVRKSLKEIMSITDIEDLPPGGMIPTGEIENMPVEGANLSVQCIKNAWGDIIWATALAGEYREDFTKAAVYVPFSEATLEKLAKSRADGEMSLIEGLALSPIFTLISDNSFANRSKPGLFQSASISRNEGADIKIRIMGGTLCKGYDISTPLGDGTVCLPFDPLNTIKARTKDRLGTMTSMQSNFQRLVTSYKSAITKLEKSNPTCFGSTPDLEK